MPPPTGELLNCDFGSEARDQLLGIEALDVLGRSLPAEVWLCVPDETVRASLYCFDDTSQAIWDEARTFDVDENDPAFAYVFCQPGDPAWLIGGDEDP